MATETPSRPVHLTHYFGDRARECDPMASMVFRIAEDHFDGMFKGVSSFDQFEEIYNRIKANNVNYREKFAETDAEREACDEIITICDWEIEAVRAYLAEQNS